MSGHIGKDISNAFNKLRITRDEKEIDDVSDKTLPLFKPKSEANSCFDRSAPG